MILAQLSWKWIRWRFIHSTQKLSMTVHSWRRSNRNSRSTYYLLEQSFQIEVHQMTIIVRVWTHQWGAGVRETCIVNRPPAIYFLSPFLSCHVRPTARSFLWLISWPISPVSKHSGADFPEGPAVSSWLAGTAALSPTIWIGRLWLCGPPQDLEVIRGGVGGCCLPMRRVDDTVPAPFSRSLHQQYASVTPESCSPQQNIQNNMLWCRTI